MSNFWGKIETGNGSKYLKLDNEETVVRVASGPSMIDVHFEESFSGVKKRIICPGAGCPLCRNGSVPYKRLTMKVISREDGQAYLFECGMMIANDIKRHALNPDYGDPTKYDIKIKKTGAGKQTKYKVFAYPNKSEVTASEATQLSEIDMSESIKVTSIEEIKAMGLKMLPIEPLNNGAKISDLEDVNDSDWDQL
jgi:hypothetical protein